MESNKRQWFDAGCDALLTGASISILAGRFVRRFDFVSKKKTVLRKAPIGPEDGQKSIFFRKLF
jgi:hypothetical protein